MADNRIYLKCAVCGEGICIGKSFYEGAYYPDTAYSNDYLVNRLNDFYEAHIHLFDSGFNLLGTNFYVEHEYFDSSLNNAIRAMYPGSRE